MGLLKILGFGKEEKPIERDKEYFQKYVNNLSSTEFDNLNYVLRLKELDEILLETRYRLNIKNRMRCAGLLSRY